MRPFSMQKIYVGRGHDPAGHSQNAIDRKVNPMQFYERPLGVMMLCIIGGGMPPPYIPILTNIAHSR